jgi:2',3'-cyclic-nucleotide 2'-phosphodiesterase (5'-nucleotidase family)
VFSHAVRRRGVVASAIVSLLAAPLVGLAASPAQANIAGTNLAIGEVYGGDRLTSAAAFAATNPGDKTATAGTAIAGFALAAAGGTPPYTWAATGMPAGVTVAVNGNVSGTPTTAGTYEVTATVTDAGTPTAATATTSFTITVAAGPVDVQILATTDFHGRIQNDTTSAAAGAAVLAGAVKQLRSANPNTVFAAAGDMIGASTFDSYIAKDKPTIDALNEAGLEVSAVGSHELDGGYNDLVNRVIAPHNAETNPSGGASWKYLGANVKFKDSDNPALAGTWIKEMDGVQVGFIGAATEHLPEQVSPSGISTITVTDTATAANAAADGLKAAGADVVVLLVNEGAASTDCATITTDTTSDFGKITSAVNGNVDAIVAGRTHLSYNCSQPVPGWSSSGRPVTTRPIVSAGQFGTNLNQINFTVDPASGAVQQKSQALLPLKTGTTGSSFNYPIDSETQAIVTTAVNKSNVLGDKPLGTISGTLTRAKLANGTTENRGGESTLGNLVAEAQRWATTDPAFGAAQIAFASPGDLRSDIVGTGDAPLTVTSKQVANVQPFAYALVNESLTGAQIKAALEQQWQPSGASRPFLKLGISKGFTYTYTPDAAQGSRVQAMYLDGTAIDLGTTYSVTVSSRLSTGMDNFSALAGTARKQDTGRTDLQAQVDYFAANVSGADGLAVDYSQRAVGASFPAGAPASYPAGGDVTVNLSSLSMTGAGDLHDTSVTASINDIDVGSFPVTTVVPTAPGYDEAGTSTVVVTLPRDLASGAHDLVVTGDQTGTEARIPFTSDAPPSVATTVSGTADPIVYGTDGAVAVTMTPSTATGTVQLLDGTTVLGTGTLTAGKVSITVDGTALDVGSHTLTLKYLGDTGFDPSAGSVAVTVVQAPTKVTSTSSPIVYGQAGAIAVTVTSSGGTPTGKVDLLDGDTVVGTGTLADGTASISVSGTSLTVGSHDLTLKYLGATAFAPSSGTIAVAVTQATPTVVVTASPSTVRVKTSNTVSVRVQAAGFTPTGQVQILSGSTVVGQGTLNAGSISVTVSPYSSAGTTGLTVSYLGDATTTTGSSGVSVTVVKQSPAMKVTAPKKIRKKSAPTVKVVLTGVGAKASGKVTFSYKGKKVTKHVRNGKVTLKLAKLTRTTTVTVKYAGDSTFNAVTKKVTIRVKK